MIQNSTRPPAGFSRGSFFLFLALAPVGIAVVFAVVIMTQLKQFKTSVSPVAGVQGFVWNDSAHVQFNSLLANIHAFTDEPKDSLWMEAGDLNLLLAASPVAATQGMRFKVSVNDSLLIIISTQPVSALHGRLSWIFRKVAPRGYLNARLEGTPELINGKIVFSLKAGYLNGQKVPSMALSHRGGMSPTDFMQDHEFYDKFSGTVTDMKLIHGKILFLK